MTFRTPCLLAQCAKNAQNALAKRHLALPKYNCEVETNQFDLFDRVRHEAWLAAACAQRECNEDWRKKQTARKLAAIDEHWCVKFRHYLRAKSFIKREVGQKVPSKARLIQAHVNFASAYDYPDEYHDTLSMLKMLNRETFSDSGIEFEFHYAGGYNHDQMSDIATRFINEMDECSLIDEADGENWDATMNEQLLSAEVRVYKLARLQSAATVAERTGSVRGFITSRDGTGEYTLQYTTKQKRLSGDWNTTAGNTLISMMIRHYAITHLPQELKPRKAQCFFMGDDYWAVYHFRSKVDPVELRVCLNQLERSCGITPVRGLFRDPLQTTFISMGLWLRRTDDGYAYQFVPHPARQMSKLFYSARTSIQGGIAAYQRALAHCDWFIYHGFHMMMDFLRVHYTPGPKAKLDLWWEEMVTYQVRNVDWAQSFTYKYGLPYEATKFEMPTEIASYRHPVVDEMLRVEGLDPPERVGCVSN